MTLDEELEEMWSDLEAMKAEQIPYGSDRDPSPPPIPSEDWRCLSPIYEELIATQQLSPESDSSDVEQDQDRPLPSLLDGLRGRISDSPDTVIDIAALQRRAGASLVCSGGTVLM